MNEELSADERHLGRMRDAIQAYFAKRLDLGRVVNNLEALLDSMERAPEDWRDEFRQQWGKLEDIVAVAADRGDPEVIDQNEKSINEALSRLLVMVETQRLGRKQQLDE
jgi:hypothetical protein